MTATQWAKTPKAYVIISMVVFLFIAAFWPLNFKGIVNAIIAVAFSTAADIVSSRMAKRKRIAPDSAAITGLIVALILSVTAPWYVVAATSVAAVLSKYLFVYKKKPIFNPAAFGLVLSILLFRTGQSWWGAFGDLPSWTVVILLFAGYTITSRVNKFPQVFSFLATYFILLFMMGILHLGDAADALRPPFINASLFFAFFMLTDPPTSPAKNKNQVVFGIFSAVVAAVVYVFFGGLMYLFIGLLAGNLYRLLPARPSLHASKLQEHQRSR